VSAPALHELRDAAVEIARGAGRILATSYRGASQVQHKGVVDLVTDADHASEAHVLGEIRRRFPGHAVLSEESGAATGDGRWRWIVDPLDGTTNFAHRIPHFSVLIAVEEQLAGGGVATRVAVTLDPLRDELFVAVAGQGATLGGLPVRVSQTRRLIDAALATGFSYRRLTNTDDNHAEFCRLNLVTQGVRRFGSAGLDLAYVACGRYDGFWEHGLSPWDFAGGALLVAEAGGRVSALDGGPAGLEAPAIAASNGCLHDDLLAALASARAHPIGSRQDLDPLLPPELRGRGAGVDTLPGLV
jgi:myo-inositol-1(or 4)-monophosphatase